MDNFLLLDFGASRVKLALYSREFGKIRFLRSFDSVLKYSNKVSLSGLNTFFDKVISSVGDSEYDAIVMCSILGGRWSDGIYYSWKCEEDQEDSNSCLLSELFKKQETYHVHNHHTSKSNIKGLSKLGFWKSCKLVYSVLGDTRCVIESLNLGDRDLLINLGTGSQVIDIKKTISYIPSGRVLNSYKVLFEEFDVDLFNEFSKLSLDDLLDSTILFDLNIFSKSYKFSGGGSIWGILEENLTKKNLIASLFRSYVDQYINIIKTKTNIENIFLTGGISNRYKQIRTYIQYKTGCNVYVPHHEEATFMGMKTMIERYL